MKFRSRLYRNAILICLGACITIRIEATFHWFKISEARKLYGIDLLAKGSDRDVSVPLSQEDGLALIYL